MELLVSMLLSAIALAVVARDFGFYVKTRANMDMVAETQQAASSSMTFLTQELRQAGACLPELGNFIALEGEDNGDRDTLTLRIGRADNDSLQCDRTILKKRAKKNESLMKVESSAGFEVGQWIYMVKATGHGNFFRIAGIDGVWIQIEGTFDKNYGRGSGVYAIEERHYEIQEIDGVPVLTVEIDGGYAQPMVRGIEKLNIEYLMDPCPPCSPVDEPSSDDQWRVVRELDITIVAKSSRPGPDGQYRTVEHKSTVKPRNLL